METGRTTILSVNVNFYVVFLGETVCSFRLFNNIFLTTLTSFLLFRAGINDQKIHWIPKSWRMIILLLKKVLLTSINASEKDEFTRTKIQV